MSAKLRTLGAAALVAASVGLLVVSSSPAAEAVPASDAYKVVAKLQFGTPGQPGSTSCSAVLVAPRWVATAKACFQPSGQTVVDGRPSQKTTALVGWSDLARAGGGQTVSVVRVVPHPS